MYRAWNSSWPLAIFWPIFPIWLIKFNLLGQIYCTFPMGKPLTVYCKVPAFKEWPSNCYFKLVCMYSWKVNKDWKWRLRNQYPCNIDLLLWSVSKNWGDSINVHVCPCSYVKCMLHKAILLNIMYIECTTF